jgi:hypothetical protein
VKKSFSSLQNQNVRAAREMDKDTRELTERVRELRLINSRLDLNR